jgi:hypothetical protein
MKILLHMTGHGKKKIAGERTAGEARFTTFFFIMENPA